MSGGKVMTEICDGVMKKVRKIIIEIFVRMSSLFGFDINNQHCPFSR